ncbi:glycine oxidase ThiO [Jatrophihabitans sp.]|uniref:glycine oxidase ThiO n=1 Tax=Jatrophihabitans sp. TaxID=1932789 RepID=UPI0030C6AE46|nr:glycine oxidase ThiO [Jatrophihabitans sp.]
MSTTDVAIVGAGVIGTAVAWRAAQRGLTVTLFDPDPTRGAWRTAAGMLAPITELHYAESALLRLNLASLARYPSFVEELGLPTGYRANGTLEVAWDAADLAALRDLHAFGTSLGLSSRLVDGAELRAIEPGLAPGLPGGLVADSDHQVDPRLLHAALTTAARAAGVRFVAEEVRDLGALAAGQVVLAAGAWSGVLGGLPVRPVKGQTLRLRALSPLASGRVVRASVKGSTVYIVPRENGDVVVGASSEEAGFDVTPRAGAVYELLRDAQTVLPELGEAELVEVSTGLRPGTADNAPLLGRGEDGVILATGHYRNGVLLTPVTADAIATLLATGETDPVIAPFTPSRTAVPA